MPSHGSSAARLTIHMAGDARWHHKPAFAEIVHRAHKSGLPGASVFHGVLGFGHHLRIHEERPTHLIAHGPCAVVIVGDEVQLRAFLDTLEDILTMTGVALVEPIEVHRHRPGV
jgi:PII-like signaling protein